MYIPVAKPFIGSEELSKVKEVFDTGWLGMGSVVPEFEESLRAYLGARHAIAVNTGTSALHITLTSLDIKKGDEVILPSLTFVSTPHAALACNAKVVFCDVQPHTLNVDIGDIRKKITGRTRAIMPVHYSGMPCDMDDILKLAKKNGIHVVEDAAHAIGSKYKGRMIGSFGDVSCFSFDPIKVITCGEGGAVATNNDRLAKKIVIKRIMGIDKDTYSRYKNRRSWFYRVKDLGYRYHMSNINAAIGMVQLKKIDVFLGRRRKIAKVYDDNLKDIKEVGLIRKDYDSIAPFNYIIKVTGNKRARLMEFLKDREIETGVHYIPNHLQPFFKKFKVRLPVTEKIAGEILTLPLYYGMKDDDVNRVVSAIKQFFMR